MKNKIVIIIFVIISAIQINAQSLIFCESIDTDNKPVNLNTNFVFNPSGNFYFFYQSPKEINKEEVYFEIYKIGTDGKENYDKTIYKDISKNSKIISHNLKIFPVGNYTVYLYTGDGIFLTSSSLKITAGIKK